jgi:uncharacterized protein YxeA
MKKLYIFIFFKVFVNISVIFFLYKFFTTDFFGKNKYIQSHKHCAKTTLVNENPFLDNDLIEHSHEEGSKSKIYVHSHAFNALKHNKYTKLKNTQLLEEYNNVLPYKEKYELQLELILKTFFVILIIFSVCCFNYIL